MAMDMAQNPDAKGDMSGAGNPDAAGDAGAQSAAAGGKPGPTELIMTVDKGLSAVAKMVASAQVPDEIKGTIQKALEMYRQGVQALMEGGPGGDQAQAPAQGPAPQGGPGAEMAGGNPNARPAY